MKLKRIALTLCILLIVITSSISYAYFTGTTSIEGNNEGLLQKLNITNGNSKVTIDTSKSIWKYGSSISETPIVETKAYIQKPSDWSEDLYIYIYDENGGKIKGWPGVKMNNEGNGLYSYTLNLSDTLGNSTKVVFSDTNGKQVPGTGQAGFELRKDEIKIYKDGNWIDYKSNDEVNQPEGDVSIRDNVAVVQNPSNNIKVNYDNVIVENKSNLTSKVKLNLDVYAIKEGGSKEDNTIPPEIDNDISSTIPEGAKAFEVLVGDIDNLNLGYKNGEDPLSGKEMSVHSLDVFPKKDDAPGTDRKMVTTGFYNFFKSISADSANYKTIYYKKKQKDYKREWPLEWQDTTREINSSFYGLVYKNSDGQWTEKSIFYDDKNEGLINGIDGIDNIGNKIGLLQYNYDGKLLNGDRGEVFYDGYTERSITKTNANGGNLNLDSNVYDVKYAELQPVEPITFNYADKLVDNEKVYSAVFQVMVDDLQAEITKEMWQQKSSNEDWIISFSPKSRAKYKVTLKVVGTDEEVEIKEFSEVINNLTQHGPKSNLVTLNLPKDYYELVEKGRVKGLELKIDDVTWGNSGDTYCIDFAKLLVNQKMDYEAKIKGTVKDTDGKPIKNAVVTNSNTGEQVLTDENGFYEFKYVLLGQTVIKVEHKSYETRMETLYSVAAGSENVVNFTLSKVYNEDAIAPNTKFTGNILIDKYNNSNEKIGETIVNELKIVESGEVNKITISTEELLVEPGFYYKIAYNLNLFNISSIDPNSKKFNIRFKSNISAEVTQENNPGWEE